MPNINIFGVKFAYPRGLRKSPGTNWLASCVRAEMHGKKGGDVKSQFATAAKTCAQRGKSG